MKNFNEVKVEEDGKISKFLVEDEEAVDAGQDLMDWGKAAFRQGCSARSSQL